ncbi:uridine 5'-monophosphate synthase-like [Lineus longissimus]|uniref:uridine 5'-monophosphate synthase-like n=1 Tax=Lineus longissimus TaxID=88925 RepID=UPI002B4C4CED
MGLESKLSALIERLYEIEAVKFGDFKLKSGIQSPVYFDLRVIISYPDLMSEVSEFLYQAAAEGGAQYQSSCGVPYTALPLATCIATAHNIPMLIRRKEAKDYGTKKMIEGKFKEGETCLIVEDVVTSGSSVAETVELLRPAGIVVRDAVVLLNREQGGTAKLKAMGVKLHSVCTLSKVLEILEKSGKLDADMVKRVKQFIKDNQFTVPPAVPSKPADIASLSYGERAKLCKNPVARRVFEVMEMKRSNLALSVDVTSADQLLKLADSTGPYICVLKTHIDILEDFTMAFVEKLKALAQKHNFVIFEDRKFADIGNTVKEQYGKGIYRIAEWADIINAHAIPGPGIITGLKQVVKGKDRGCLMIAEMSSAGNLAKDGYTEACVKMSEENNDFVIGFICQQKLSQDPCMIHMTPGVKLEEGGDQLGQQYLTPSSVIAKKGTDVIIVGRGITQAPDPVEAAKLYRDAGYQAYQTVIGH